MRRTFWYVAGMSEHPESAAAPGRLLVVDLARGVAIAMMVVYHFCFDLAHFRLARFDFYNDPFWLNFRTLILGLFLLLVGVSLVLATRRRIETRRILARLLRVGAGAALVSLATWWMFGDRFVFFGVLHFIVVASVLGLLFVRRPPMALAAGLVLLLVGNRLQSPWFDQPGWRWIGLMTHKPATEDYVPLLPWLGVVLTGIFIGGWLCRSGRLRALDARMPGQRPWARALAFSGRHSLLIYLLHQPLLFGLITAVLAVSGR